MELCLMKVVNAFCGLFCCGHCHKAVAASSRTPGICHNLGTHHLDGKHRNMSWTRSTSSPNTQTQNTQDHSGLHCLPQMHPKSWLPPPQIRTYGETLSPGTPEQAADDSGRTMLLSRSHSSKGLLHSWLSPLGKRDGSGQEQKESETEGRVLPSFLQHYLKLVKKRQ